MTSSRFAQLAALGAVIVVAGYTFVRTENCQPVLSTEEAGRLAKDYFRADRAFHKRFDLTENDVDRILSRCCNPEKGDYFIHDDSRWRVFLSGPGFQYELFFDPCGRDIRRETLAE